MSCKEHPAAPASDCESCRADVWMNTAQFTAASNARLCEIALKADALAKAVESLVQDANRSLYTNLRKALDDYKIARQGQ